MKELRVDAGGEHGDGAEDEEDEDATLQCRT